MGQFTGLFNGLETDNPKQSEAKETAKTGATKRSAQPKPAATPDAQTANNLKTANKLERKKPNNDQKAKVEQTAPMRGKRSHPDYTQAPAFVRKGTYKAVKIALLNDERGLDYSDLVEQLLTSWLSDKK